MYKHRNQTRLAFGRCKRFPAYVLAGERWFAVDTGFPNPFGVFNIDVEKRETFILFFIRSEFERKMYTIEFNQIFFGFFFVVKQHKVRKVS